MIGWLRRLFAAPTCPGCRREYVEWTDQEIERGYCVERKWTGCPEYRDALSHPNPLAVIRNHGARYRVGRRTPLVDFK